MPFGIALADQEHDRRGVGRRLFGQALRQSAGILPRVLGDRIDVAFERQRHHIGVEPVDHRARLLARAAMRGLDGDRLAGLRLPMRGEGRVEFLVEFPRRIIGDVEQGRIREGETEPSELDRARQSGRKDE